MTSASAPCPDPAQVRRRRRHLALGAAGVVVCLAGVVGVAAGVLDPRTGEPVARKPGPGAGGPVTPETTVTLAGASVVKRSVTGRTLHVVPKRAGVARGAATGTETAPYTDLQTAIYAASPGDTVLLGAGTFDGEFETVRNGDPGAPITIAGTPGRTTLRGKGIDKGRVLTVQNDWIVVTGLRITRGDKGIWVQQARNVTLRGNTVRDTGGECIRVKYLSQRNEIAGNRVGPCGAVNFDLKASRKNGEGIYVGTAPEQLSRNPTKVSDASNQNWVHGNVISTRAECVDLKEGAELNVVERNTCSGGLDPDGSGLDSRGNNNVFRYNTVSDVVGKGVRLGGDTKTQGLDNAVFGNTLVRTGGHAVGAMRMPQKLICGNTIGRNKRGPANLKTLLPQAPCPSTVRRGSR
jgi:parallel beta-helix repeat protein